MEHLLVRCVVADDGGGRVDCGESSNVIERSRVT